MAFATKGQTKAAAAFKGNFGVYGPNFAQTLCVGGVLSASLENWQPIFWLFILQCSGLTYFKNSYENTSNRTTYTVK